MKSQNRPLYKYLIKIRENIQNWKKIFKFKKQKWENFVNFYSWKFKRFWKFWAKDQNRYLASKRPYFFFSYKKRYNNTQLELKKLRLFYGHLSKHSLKIVLNHKHKSWTILNFMESRLNAVLHRSHFVESVKSADQMILWRGIRVNNKLVTAKAFLLNQGDVLQINPKNVKFVWTNVKQVKSWPYPPKHLIINYKILQVIFGSFKQTNLTFNFFHRINIEKLLTSKYS